MERIVDLLTPAASLHHHGIGYAFDGVRLVATARSEGSEIPDEDTPHRNRTLVHVHAPAVGEQRLHVILARFRHEPVLPGHRQPPLLLSIYNRARSPRGRPAARRARVRGRDGLLRDARGPAQPGVPGRSRDPAGPPA